MPIDWSPFVDVIHRHQRFLLTTHVRPDPDGLGSLLALADVLQRQGKSVQMLIASVWPPRYSFLDPERRIQRFAAPGEEYRSAEVAIILDTGTWNQLGDFGPYFKGMTAQKIVIDHHLSQDELGAQRFVDVTAEATGRLVYEVVQALGVPLSAQAAQLLFAAVATDTGWFRHSNTTTATFALAEKLVAAGAQPTLLYEYLYEQSTLPRLKLMGRALDRLTVLADGKIAYSEIQQGDYQATGAIPSDTEELINLCRSVAGVEVALVFMEQPAGGVKISFRARSRIDVAKLAERFGGGGHRLASGAILQTSLPEARQRVLAAVQEALAAVSV